MNGAASRPTTPELIVYAATSALKFPGPRRNSRISCGPSGIMIMKSMMWVNCTAASSSSRERSDSGVIRAVRSPFGFRARQRSLSRVVLPSAAEGFDQLHGGDQALSGELGVGALGLKRVAAGVHDFEITHDTGAIAVGGQLGGAPRVRHRALLSGGLVNQMTNAGQAVFHFAESDEDLLAIARHRFFKGGL